MSSENVIHIRLSYMEALKAKRGILASELGSLNIAKKIARYRAVRMEELRLKSILYGKIKEAKSNIRKLQILLPNPRVPKLIRREHAMEKQLEKEEAIHNEGDIESQLREIEGRLERLQRQNI